MVTMVSGSLAGGMACSGSPTEPTDMLPANGSTPNLITITGAGAQSNTITIRVSERVLFTNSDTVDHEMSSDDHPTHEHCPQINQVGYLKPGESRETGNFIRVQTCTFHDQINTQNESLNGQIIVME